MCFFFFSSPVFFFFVWKFARRRSLGWRPSSRLFLAGDSIALRVVHYILMAFRTWSPSGFYLPVHLMIRRHGRHRIIKFPFVIILSLSSSPLLRNHHHPSLSWLHTKSLFFLPQGRDIHPRARGRGAILPSVGPAPREARRRRSSAITDGEQP